MKAMPADSSHNRLHNKLGTSRHATEHCMDTRIVLDASRLPRTSMRALRFVLLAVHACMLLPGAPPCTSFRWQPSLRRKGLCRRDTAQHLRSHFGALHYGDTRCHSCVRLHLVFTLPCRGRPSDVKCVWRASLRSKAQGLSELWPRMTRTGLDLETPGLAYVQLQCCGGIYSSMSSGVSVTK